MTTAVCRFNRYCAELTALYDPEWNIPLPRPLPITIAELRKEPDLLEDVWIYRTEVAVPPWLGDSTVRNGIRGMLRQDRCLEERRRLGEEADNLCRWFGKELHAIDNAIVMYQGVLTQGLC